MKVPLLNFEGGSGVPLLNFEGGPGSWDAGPTFTPCRSRGVYFTRKTLA